MIDWEEELNKDCMHWKNKRKCMSPEPLFKRVKTKGKMVHIVRRAFNRDTYYTYSRVGQHFEIKDAFSDLHT